MASGRSLSMPPDSTKRCASPGGQKPEHLQPQPHERREAVVHLRKINLGGRDAGVSPTSRRAVCAPPSTMSSSGQCSGRRRRGRRAGGVAGDIHRRVRQILRALGGGEARKRPRRRRGCRSRSGRPDRKALAPARYSSAFSGRSCQNDHGMRAPFLRASTSHGRHRLPARAVALQVLVVGQRDHGQRPEKALRRGPLHRSAGLAASGWRGIARPGCAGRGGTARSRRRRWRPR